MTLLNVACVALYGLSAFLYARSGQWLVAGIWTVGAVLWSITTVLGSRR